MKHQNSLRAIKKNLVFLVAFVLASCVEPKIVLDVNTPEPTAPPASSVPGGVPEATATSPPPLHVAKSITHTCRKGELREAIVTLDVSGGVPPYNITPNPEFSILHGYSQYIWLVVQSQDGQEWKELLDVFSLCKDQAPQNNGPVPANQPTIQPTVPPNPPPAGQPTTPPNPQPTSDPKPPACSDGKDNDKDGDTDHPADQQCSSANDTSEYGGGNDDD